MSEVKTEKFQKLERKPNKSLSRIFPGDCALVECNQEAGKGLGISESAAKMYIFKTENKTVVNNEFVTEVKYHSISSAQWIRGIKKDRNNNERANQTLDGLNAIGKAILLHKPS
jgi:hypothetical protein